MHPLLEHIAACIRLADVMMNGAVDSCRRKSVRLHIRDAKDDWAGALLLPLVDMLYGQSHVRVSLMHASAMVAPMAFTPASPFRRIVCAQQAI